VAGRAEGGESDVTLVGRGVSWADEAGETNGSCRGDLGRAEEEEEERIWGAGLGGGPPTGRSHGGDARTMEDDEDSARCLAGPGGSSAGTAALMQSRSCCRHWKLVLDDAAWRIAAVAAGRRKGKGGLEGLVGGLTVGRSPPVAEVRPSVLSRVFGGTLSDRELGGWANGRTTVVARVRRGGIMRGGVMSSTALGPR